MRFVFVIGILLACAICRCDKYEAKHDLDIEKIQKVEEIIQEDKSNVDQPNVLSITNFHNSLSDNKIYIVKYVTNWCEYCKKLQPVWDQLIANRKERNDERVELMTINCEDSENSEICAKYASGYPTLYSMMKVDGNGNAISNQYKGNRTFESLNEFIENNLNIKELVFLDRNAVKERLKEFPYTIVFLCEDDECTGVWSKLSFKFCDKHLIATNDRSFGEDYGLQKGRNLLAFRDYDNATPEIYEGNLKDDDMVDVISFIAQRSHSFLYVFDKVDMHDVLTNDSTLLIGLCEEGDEKQAEEIRSLFREVYKQKKSELIYFIIEKRIPDMDSAFNLDKYPAVVMNIISNMFKYRFEGDLKAPEVINFANDVLTGTATPYLRSEDFDEKIVDGLLAFSSKSFVSKITKPSLKSLVYFNVPNNHYAMNSIKLLKEFATIYKDVPDFQVCTLSLVNNDLPPELSANVAHLSELTLFTDGVKNIVNIPIHDRITKHALCSALEPYLGVNLCPEAGEDDEDKSGEDSGYESLSGDFDDISSDDSDIDRQAL